MMILFISLCLFSSFLGLIGMIISSFCNRGMTKKEYNQIMNAHCRTPKEKVSVFNY